MILDFTTMTRSYKDLLSDIIKYETIDKYVSARLAGSCLKWPAFCAMELSLRKPGTDTWVHLIENGRITDDAFDHLEWLRRLPDWMRNFSSDDIVLAGDGIEQILCISWK